MQYCMLDFFYVDLADLETISIGDRCFSRNPEVREDEIDSETAKHYVLELSSVFYSY